MHRAAARRRLGSRVSRGAGGRAAVELGGEAPLRAGDLVAVAEPQPAQARCACASRARIRPRPDSDRSARAARRSPSRAAARRRRGAAAARRRGGAWADLLLRLLDLGVGRLEASTSWTMMQILPASLWSTRPRTSTISSASSSSRRPPSAFSNTTISTLPSRSSSVANIIVEPERVRIFFDSVIMPPTFTQSPSRCSATWRSRQSALAAAPRARA